MSDIGDFNGAMFKRIVLPIGIVLVCGVVVLLLWIGHLV
jgi:hypothetical protein